MAVNEALPRADQFTLLMPTNGGTASPANPQYVASPAAPDPLGNIGSGDPLIWGVANSPSVAVALVAEENYNPPGSLVATGNIAVKRVGAFFFIVAGKTSINPGSGKAIKPGDPVYADGGVIDTTSGILSGITLNANSSTGWIFGHAMDPVTSGASATIRVLIGAK